MLVRKPHLPSLRQSDVQDGLEVGADGAREAPGEARVPASIAQLLQRARQTPCHDGGHAGLRLGLGASSDRPRAARAIHRESLNPIQDTHRFSVEQDGGADETAAGNGELEGEPRQDPN